MDRDTESVIEEVLDGRPRAAELAEMIAALRTREAAFQRELAAATTDAARKDWTSRLKDVRKQIGVLREEQAITEFVEVEVRAAVNRPRPRLTEFDD